MTLQIVPQRIPSVRGLIPLRNQKGRPYSLTDVHRWIRLNRTVFNIQKLDVFAPESPGDLGPDHGDILAYAQGLDLPLSLRSDCRATPATAGAWTKLPYFDVFLCPDAANAPKLDPWLERCAAANLHIRLQLPIPLPAECRPDALAGKFAASNVVAVNLTTLDPFQIESTAPAEDSAAALGSVIALTEALAERNIEVNLLGLPLNRVPKHLHHHVVRGGGIGRDHQQYEPYSIRLAADLYRRSPYVAGKIIMAMLARYTSAPSPVDKTLLEWLFIKHRFLYFWALFFRKFSRDWRRPLGPPRPLRETSRAAVDELTSLLPAPWKDEPQSFRERFPHLASPDDDWAQPPAWRQQPKFYDAIDQARIDPGAGRRALAETAQSIITNRLPGKTVDASEYGAYKTFHEPLSNAVRWMSIANTEQVSSGIATLDGPFTASVTFGGGHAEYAGFAFGRHCRILCPMEGFNHRVTLHAATDGSFVLLRDGVIMTPVEFHGQYYVPARIVYPVELQLCLWNIDDHISTQGVDLWFGEHEGIPDRSRVQYSVVIFSTRFSRRLQFVLQSVIHQKEIAPGSVEVIVGYVPGVDTTDDVIDSLRVTHPHVPIVRMPFPPQNLQSKGFVLNECMRAAKGEWIIILDSDILLPPDMFRKIEQQGNGAVFMAPQGRHMLDRATTAKILLGEILPWESWDTLVAESRDNREGEAEGIPIGYCQIVKAECLEKVQYAEFEHFEGADSDFGLDMRRTFGNERRLDTPVLHLDHGGSQWFGAYKHQ